MANTPTTSFRLPPRDRRYLERFANEFAISRSQVVHVALLALQRDAEFREEVRAESTARAFLDRLRASHGPHAMLSYDEGAPNPMALIDGHSADDVNVAVRRSEHFLHVDLIDPLTHVGIFNAYVKDVDDQSRHLFIPLASFYVSSVLETEERETRVLPDGRTAVVVYEDDGTAKSYVLDSKGKSSLLHEEAQAKFV